MRILFGVLVVWQSFAVSAQKQTMRDAFVNMPDSLMPGLSHNNRLDMIDFMDSGMKSEVTNLFDGKSSMTVLDERYLKLKLNASVSVEMLLLADSAVAVRDSSDAYICMVTTYGTVPVESKVVFYDYKWRKRTQECGIIEDYMPELISRPDTMAADSFESLKPLLAYMTVVAELSPEDNSMTLRAEFPLLSSSEREKAISIVRKRQVNLSDRIQKNR
ncbi:DUF3256 family protein [Xylanibacter muris]|uniref:DUF3256 family protein n=1 Tax=Xylanibacter muris TaxID=2736290 RepID=A0ABX2APS5_9BACT|nr:DUF3256 family protein [Xylanibacter muris]NPD92200.1 DUF3256 family protein [Xylanibacter muris]